MTQLVTAETTEHYTLALAWCRWNGLRGTEKQVAHIMKTLPLETLRTMLTVRLGR